MLKTRNLILTLSLSPLLSFAWQLPNQAQSFSPSQGTAGVDAGAATGGSQTSGFSTPTGTTQATTQATTTAGTPVTIPIEAGVEITIVTGVSTDGKLSVATTTVGDTDATVAVTAATVESTSSSVTVTDGATANTVVITLAPQSQVVVNQLAAAIVQNLNSIISGGTTGGGTTGGGTADVATLLTGGAGSQQAAVALTNSFTAAGISPQLATALVTSLTGLFASNTGSLPNQPVALTTSGQIVASAKAFKPVTIIAQGGAGLRVNINKLNDAIVAYNVIILKSEPQAVKNLYRNGGFVGIGGILKQLRTAVK
ncbi:MAG: hypothetical protein ACOVQ3_14880 [Dolichospermum sp.]|jgi:hypothetical protein